jgi:hypothetical protein
LKINTYITQGPPPQAYGNHLHQPPPPGAYATEYNVAQMQAPQGNFAPIAPGPGGLASAISNGLAANGFNDSYSTIGQYALSKIIQNMELKMDGQSNNRSAENANNLVVNLTAILLFFSLF